MKLWKLAVASALVLCVGGAVAAQETKQPAKKAPAAKTEQAKKKAPAGVQLPAAISEAFARAYPNAKITRTSKETEGGKTVYEVESTDQGMSRDLIYHPDGTVVEIEEGINPAELPAPVADALKKLYPNAKVTKAEKLTRGSTLEFELALSGAPKKAVAFTPDGNVVPPQQPKKPAAKTPAKKK